MGEPVPGYRPNDMEVSTEGLSDETAKELARFVYYVEDKEPELITLLEEQGIYLTCERYGEVIVDIKKPDGEAALLIRLDDRTYHSTIITQPSKMVERSRRAMNAARRALGREIRPLDNLETIPLTESAGQKLLASIEVLRD